MTTKAEFYAQSIDENLGRTAFKFPTCEVQNFVGRDSKFGTRYG